MSPPGRSKGEHRRAPQDGFQSSPPGRTGGSQDARQAETATGVGLLTGLARRALGLETPLQSQRSTRSWPGSATPGFEPADAFADLLHPDNPLSPLGTPGPLATATTAIATPSQPALATDGAAPRPGLGQAQLRGAGSTPRQRPPTAMPVTPTALLPGTRIEARLGDADTQQHAAAPVVGGVYSLEHAADSPATEGRHTPPQTRSWFAPSPRPLMPQQALRPQLQMPGVGSAAAADAGRGRRSAALHAQATPTEVHVSIGRVELTAIAASSATARPRPRRAPADGRTLADYLHGGSGSGSKRP